MILFTSFSRAGLVKVVLLPEMLGTAVEVFRLLVAELRECGQTATVLTDAGSDAVLYFVDAAAHFALNIGHKNNLLNGSFLLFQYLKPFRTVFDLILNPVPTVFPVASR